MYSDNDLENIIAICEQDENATSQASKLKRRCERALAYRDCSLRITKSDKDFLSLHYDEEMDPDAKKTLERILRITNDRDALLKSKGFKCNHYLEGDYWELKVEDDKKMKEIICFAFRSIIDIFVDAIDIETIILQCRKDHSQCIFYFDCNLVNVNTNDFFACLQKI